MFQALTAAEFLNSTPAPRFRPGNSLPHLPPGLAQAAWPLDYDTSVALCENWGYCLLFQDSIANLSNPTSDGSRMCALSAADPQQYPLTVDVPLPMQSDSFLQTLPDAAWTHNPDGSLVTPLLFSPAAPDSVYQAVAVEVVAYLAAIQQTGATITVALNTGEEGLTVAGNAGGHWFLDPAVIAAVGTATPTDMQKDTFISAAKAHQETIVANAVKAQVPNLLLYEFYTTAGEPERGIDGLAPPGTPDEEWIWYWEYANMREVSTLPSDQMYYAAVNSGWPAQDNLYTNGDALMEYLNSVAQQISFGDPLSYNWVSAGWLPGLVSDDAHYIGMLKCMYTAGMVGGIAGYFSYPPDGFTGDQGSTPPNWLVQMEDLGQVHAVFSFLDDFLYYGDLLPGPNNHVWSTDLPAYEFPTGDANARVLVRQLTGQSEWLICAWAATGPDRQVTVTIL